MKKPFLVKMALIIVAVCIVLAVSMVLVMNHYARLVEVQALQQEVTYVSAAIGEKQNELLAKARDWATWDDSYKQSEPSFRQCQLRLQYAQDEQD